MQRRGKLPPLRYQKPLRGRTKPPGTIILDPGTVTVLGFSRLPEVIREDIFELLARELDVHLPMQMRSAIIDLMVQRYCRRKGESHGRIDLVPMIARRLAQAQSHPHASVVPVSSNSKVWTKTTRLTRSSFVHFDVLDFDEINSRAKAFAYLLQERASAVIEILQRYECHNVIMDELVRSTDHLTHLDKNASYFRHQVGMVKSHLPSNQPLYSLVCFGIVPALMATEVLVRPPTLMQDLLAYLSEVLSLNKYFPNLSLRCIGGPTFAAERRDETFGVIFTGTSAVADVVRQLYPSSALFILNGSGHNPVVVTETADVHAAVRSVIGLCLHNQGQDCAAPNSLLVATSKLDEFLELLLHDLRRVDLLVGPYEDSKNIVGPNSRPNDLLRIASMFRQHATWLGYGGDVNFATSIVRPTVFVKPLAEGAALSEFFAPVFMVQPYGRDQELSDYFSHPDYARNAMYVTVFGDSDFVRILVERELHTDANVLWDTDLHVEERGWRPYGGMGQAASCVYADGICIPGPTLPQRDLFLHAQRRLSSEKADRQIASAR